MSAHYHQLHGRRVLVAGSTGFLGHTVVRELLANGVDVLALVRDRAADVARDEFPRTPRLRILRGRIEDTFRVASALAIHDIAAVVHLATCHPTQVDRGTSMLTEAVQLYNPCVPIILARPDSAPALPHSGVIGVARFGAIYGGGDRNIDRIVPATIVSLLTGDRGRITPDSRSRDFVHVEDAARACCILANFLMNQESPRWCESTFASGIVMNDREMVMAIRDAFDGREVLNPVRTSTNHDLGWSARVSLNDGLRSTIGWYREFLRNRFFGTKPTLAPQRAAA